MKTTVITTNPLMRHNRRVNKRDGYGQDTDHVLTKWSMAFLLKEVTLEHFVNVRVVALEKSFPKDHIGFITQSK